MSEREAAIIFPLLEPFPANAAHEEAEHLHNVTAKAVRSKRIGQMVAATLIGLTPPAVIVSLYTHNRWLQTADEPGDMVEDVSGCPTFSQPTIEQKAPKTPAALGQQLHLELSSLAVELGQKDTRSAAENFHAKDFELVESIKQWAEVLRYEQVDFTSQYSGVRIHIFSDTDNAFEIIDTSAFDELMHAGMSRDMNFKHAGLQAFSDCMYRRFIDPSGPRELEGRDLNVFIPSDYGVCFKNGVIQFKPKQAEKTYCESVGWTKTDLTFALPPFIDSSFDWSVIMATDHTKADAESQLSERIIHELSGHYFLQLAGQVFKWDPNEMAADEITKEVMQQLYSDQPPTAIAFSS